MKKSLNGKHTNTSIEDKHNIYGSLKKMKVDQILCLNSISFDIIEAIILDLKELNHQAKWLKRIIEIGMALSDTVRSFWKIIEYRGFCTSNEY